MSLLDEDSDLRWGKDTYHAECLKQTLHGNSYQLKHLMLIMHSAWKLDYSFRLATEMKAAGKFDDVVLHYRKKNLKQNDTNENDTNENDRNENKEIDNMYLFIQLKHSYVKHAAISAQLLLNTTDRDYSLRKYFVSWLKIIENPHVNKSKSRDFVLCTNIGLKVENLKTGDITLEEVTRTDKLLNLRRNVGTSEKQPRGYKLKITKSSEMWATLKKACNGQDADVQISRFLNEFILAVNQPNEIKLGEIIERKIGIDFNRLDAGIVRDLFQIEVFDWFKTEEGTFLTDVNAAEFFNKIKGKLDAIKTMAVDLNHKEKLEKLGIRFNAVNTMIQNFINRPREGSKRLLEIISGKQTLLTALLVCQTLAQRQKVCENETFTFVRLETLSREKISQLVLRAFEWSPDQNLLIVDCESISAKQHLQSLWNPICKIMANNVNKKMILITQSGKDLGSECYLDREICRVDNTGYSFENLTNESRKKLLGKRVTKFRGTNNNTNLAKLLRIPDSDNLGEDYVKTLSNIIDTDRLVQLISEEELQIGPELDRLVKDAIRELNL